MSSMRDVVALFVVVGGVGGLAVLVDNELKVKPVPKPVVVEKVEAVKAPVAEPLSVAEVLACDRLAYERRWISENRAEDTRLLVEQLRDGDEAYVWTLVSVGGKLFVPGYIRTEPRQVGSMNIRLRRIRDGVLVSCEGDMLIDVNESRPEGDRWTVAAMIPVVGTFVPAKGQAKKKGE